MSTKKMRIVLIVVVLFIAVAVIFRTRSADTTKTAPTTESTVRFVSSAITVDGTVTAQSQATLSFQAPGKLVYLPFKAGDAVGIGQTIAQLDTYQLQRQLTAALNTYRSSRDTFDQTKENSQNNVLNGQQQPIFSKVNTDNSTAVNDAIKRIVDQNQANLDNSVVTVELANYALQLSRLTSPLNGIITRQDVTVPGINITPATTFTVADPDTMVFRANVPTSAIYYIFQGSPVTLAIDGITEKIAGTVERIYPSKVILSSGQSVYQVDIAGDNLRKLAKLDLAGTAIISTNAENVALVPAWTVLGGRYIWVDDNGTPELRKVTAGKIHGNEIEVTGGLSRDDKIITDPKIISALKYKLL